MTWVLEFHVTIIHLAFNTWQQLQIPLVPRLQRKYIFSIITWKYFEDWYNLIFIQTLFPYRISWLIEHKYKWNPFCEILWYINWKSADCEVDFKLCKILFISKFCLQLSLDLRKCNFLSKETVLFTKQKSLQN